MKGTSIPHTLDIDLHSSYDDGCSQGADNGSCDVGRNAILVFYEGRDGICLYGAADAERGYRGKECEEDGEPFPAQALLEGVHRTTQASVAALGLYTVFYC